MDFLGTGDRLQTFAFSIKPISNQQGKVIFLILEGHNIPDREFTISGSVEQVIGNRQQAIGYSEQSHQQNPLLPVSGSLFSPQAEQALLESEERFRATFEQVAVGLAHVGLDGRWLRVNQKLCEILGYTREELLNLTWVEISHSDDLRIDLRNICQLLAGKISTYSLEKRYIRKDGLPVWVNLTVSLLRETTKALPEPKYFIAVIEDITKRKQVEVSIRETEARFRIMADTAPVMIWMSDLDKLCNFFNKGWLEFTGRTMAQELGNGWREGVHPEDLERCIYTYTSSFDTRSPFVIEYRLRRFDGEYRWVLDKGSPRFASDGDFAGFIGSCIDISERKQAELALQQRAEELTYLNTILTQTTAMLQKRNQELDQFAYVASHDLKAPLRAIASLSQWLEEDLAGQLSKENQHQLDLLRGRVQRMEGLINGLLEYSRIGRNHTDQSLVNVGDLLQEVIDYLEAPLSFRIEVASEMPTFMTKRIPLQQVFTNLIENAIKHHSHPDGRVKISVNEQGKYYKFTVADDGPGIPAQYHHKVFTIFQTLEARDRKEGTGIGLAIVKKIIETEGGTINLDSSSGVGSSFHFTWPKQLGE
ncbi:PAS domain S-box protein [Nostoc sp. FACHB-152]|nr:PAS domain S-box protein [Nostoc sp. FACHB-152]MBD2471686.1 PAS domain S-box protein [Nostoc sp. FACHB-145]